MHCTSAQNLTSVTSFIPSKVTDGSQILNLGYMTLTTPTLGVICYPMANTCCVEYATKYEVSI